MAGNDGYAGQAGKTSGSADRNLHHFQTKQSLAEVRTMMPVKVVAVHGGGVGPDPTVDVQILVNQTDGLDNATPHGTVYGIPAPRNQSGSGVVINDPAAGDIGWMHVADRDISSFKATGSQSNPGSKRRFSPSDGVYIRGHNAKGTPKQYVQFRSDGVTVMDANGHQVTTSKSQIIVAPKDTTAMVILGGDGKQGQYDFVVTSSGPSINVKARVK